MIRFGIGGTTQPFIQGFADFQNACSFSSVGGSVATHRMSLMRCSSFCDGVFSITLFAIYDFGFSTILIFSEASKSRAFRALASM